MESVTDEILLMIFQYLSTDDVICISLVNKRFSNVARDPSLHRFLKFKNNLHVSSAALHRYACIFHTHIQSLKFQDCFWISSYQLVAALQRCTKLKELILIGSRLSISGLIKITSSNPNLQRLGWSIPNSNISSELRRNGKPTVLFNEIQSVFKKVNGILLRFETLVSFEQFLPVFDTKELYVHEFGLEYLSDRTSSYFTIGNSYSLYVKCKEQFQLCLSDAIVANRFLHFNLLIMDFVIQTVTKAAETAGITVLLAPGNTNSLCWKYVLPLLSTVSFERIDLSHCMLAKEQMTWLSKLTKLTHLNLSNVGSFKANLMKVIAANCKDLTVLNLKHCDDWIDKDLYGLDAIATHCTKLAALNLSCLHVHAGNMELNRLCSIISRMKNLKSFALSACSLINNISISDNETVQSLSSRKSSLFIPQVVSNLVVSYDTSSSSLDSTEFNSYLARKLRSSHGNETDICHAGCGLDTIASSCIQLEELEIIDTGFHSAFSRLSNNRDLFFCPQTAHLKDKNFLSICQLVNLRKLTLAGLSGVGNFSSLCKITASCQKLEDLSIAHCGLSGHSGALSSLKQSLLNCTRLKRFRLDQPHFVLKEQLLETLYNCKQLEILCIISKNGKVPKNPHDYMTLLQQCTHLVGLFLFSGFLSSESKKIQTKLSKSFSKSRPSLSVTILPYFNALTEEGLKQVPYLYLRDIIRFESHVAVCDGSY